MTNYSFVSSGNGSGLAASGNINNCGTVISGGDNHYDITVGSFTNANITNSGSVFTNGSNAYGIYAGGVCSTVLSSGNVKVASANSVGVHVAGTGLVGNASDTIFATGSNSYGIYAGVNATINVLSGANITVSGAGSKAVYADGVGAVIYLKSSCIFANGLSGGYCLYAANNATIYVDKSLFSYKSAWESYSF